MRDEALNLLLLNDEELLELKYALNISMAARNSMIENLKDKEKFIGLVQEQKEYLKMDKALLAYILKVIGEGV